MGSATNTIATIFGVGILAYFGYKVILPKLKDSSGFQMPEFNFPTLQQQPQQQQQPAPPTPETPTPTPTPTPPPATKQPTKSQQKKQPILTPTNSEMTSPNVAGTAFTFNVVGDIDDNALAAATAQNLCGGNPTVVLIIGDFAYHCNAQKWWTGSMKACNGHKNVLGSVGNHDCSGKGFLDLFPANGGKWEFTKKVGNIAFIAVNTGYCSARCMNVSTSEPLFKQAQADPSVKFIVAHFHKPIFTTGTAPDAPMELHNMMKKYSKVKMAFAGHNHSYRRYVPIEGIQYITAGAGGHDKTKSTPVTKGPSSGSVGVVKCRVSQDGSITCQYVATNNGEILDSWGVTADGRHTGTGGVTPKGGSLPAESGYVQAYFAGRSDLLNHYYSYDKEERDNAVLAMMDMRNAILHPQRKFNNKIYHYSRWVR